MASLIAKRIDEIVVSGLWPLLKQEGFRRSGRIFRRTVGDAIHVVEVQADKHNEGMHGSFTVNLGLYFKNLERENKRLPPTDAPGSSRCSVRTRIGRLLPKPMDYWWRLEQDTDLATVAAEVTNAVREYGLPWLANTTEDDARRAMAASPLNLFMR